VLAAYFCKIYIQLSASQMQISFSWMPIPISQMHISFSRPPTGCKFHSVGRQPDANCIGLAAIQYKKAKFINSLHAAGDQPNEICIPLADSRMQILQKKQLAHCLAISVLQARWDDIFLN
jgi:hypothetical protein